MKKAGYVLFTLVFFLLCLVPGVGMLVRGPAPAAANELPAARPTLFRPDGSFNTQVLSQTQTYVAKSFFPRLEAITLWDTICAEGFATSGDGDVLIGPDGWLFYSADVPDMTGSSQLTDREIWCAARSLALMQEYVQSQGARFLFTVPCGKYTLYPAHAPDLVTVAGGSNRTRLEAELREQQVNYVDLYEPFSREGEELYWHWDSHWHSRGAALAADTILAAAGVESAYFTGPFAEEDVHVGDLYEMLYPTGRKRETDYRWEPGFTFTYLSSFHSADDISIETANPEAGGSLLMFRDSSGRNLYPYMAQSFGHAFFSRQNNYRLSAVKDYEATVVVAELAERTLPYLLQYPAVYPAPVRDRQVLETARQVESTLRGEEPGQSLEGYQKISGTLPETAVDDCIYVLAGESVYEAIPSGESFTLYLPQDISWEGVCVYAGSEREET